MSEKVDNLSGALSNLGKQAPPVKAAKTKLIVIVVAVVVAIIAVIAGMMYINSANQTKTLASASLTKVVNITKLSTAELSYEGIADKYDDNGDLRYHVFYKSTVTASVDMTKIDFSDIDEEKKVVRPKLPEIVIGDPVIDETSFDYIPNNPGVEMKDVVSICKEDARHDANQNDLILDTAERNLKQVVEALTKPILDEAGYALDWSNVDENADTEGSSDAAA